MEGYPICYFPSCLRCYYAYVVLRVSEERNPIVGEIADIREEDHCWKILIFTLKEGASKIHILGVFSVHRVYKKNNNQPSIQDSK